MASAIFLTSDQDDPLRFDWSNNMYQACPDCVRAHELRTCNGGIKVSFQLCEKHHDAISNPFFDAILLDDIRLTIYAAYPADSSVPVSTEEQVPILLTPALPASNTKKLDLAQPQITYAHAPGCCLSPHPEAVVISTAAISLLDTLASERLKNINLLLDSELPLDARPILNRERIRLEHCLSSTNVAKGMYLKRCNGEFRNALDDELIPDARAPNGYYPSDFGYAVLDLDGPRERKRWRYDPKGWPMPVPTTFTYKDLKTARDFMFKNCDKGEEEFVRVCWWRIRSGKRSEEGCRKMESQTTG